MKHVFLSPHADDAALSCGGLIAQRVRAGDEVIILTVMMGAVPEDVLLTPFIVEHFARWGLGSNPVAGRKREDRAAAQILGAHLHFDNVPDALYRPLPDRSGWLYPDRDALFGAIHAHDPASASLAGSDWWELLEAAEAVYVPLGAGNHVDHQIVRNAVLTHIHSDMPVAYFLYEEYPYSAEGTDVVAQARAAVTISVTPYRCMLDKHAMQIKVDAIACYRSQISTFWTDLNHMREQVYRDSQRVGKGRWAERVWHVAGPLPPDIGLQPES